MLRVELQRKLEHLFRLAQLLLLLVNNGDAPVLVRRYESEFPVRRRARVERATTGLEGTRVLLSPPPALPLRGMIL